MADADITLRDILTHMQNMQRVLLERMDALDARMTTLEQRVARLEQRVAALEQRVAALEQQMQEVLAVAYSLGIRVKAIETEKLPRRVRALERRFTSRRMTSASRSSQKRKPGRRLS